MNDNELTAVMENATQRLSPDVTGIVERVASQGRRRVRRRRGITMIAIAAVASIGFGGVLLQMGDASERVTDAPLAEKPGVSSQRVLVDDQALVAQLRASLPNGTVSDVEVTDEPGDPGFEDGVQVSLLLDGAPVILLVADASVDRDVWIKGAATLAGPRPVGCDSRSGLSATLRRLSDIPMPSAACDQWLKQTDLNECVASPKCVDRATIYRSEVQCDLFNGPCSVRADGSSLYATSTQGSASSYQDHSADFFTPDGWRVLVSAANSSDPVRPGVQVLPTPILTEQQVKALAMSDVWFK